MKKRLLFFTTFILTIFFFNIKEVDAFSIDDYKHRTLCGNFELAEFLEDGTINPIGCYNTYEHAKHDMLLNGADHIAIMTNVNGVVRIIDANVALLDLTVNPVMTYFYENPGYNNRKYTYMDTGSLYGGVDGAHIETVYNEYGWSVKTKIGNFTGWLRLIEDGNLVYEIVPITWVKSSSSYTVTNDYIKHNYVEKIQNNYTGSRGSTIGPKPDMLNPGTYYSYDGHFFYNDLKTMIKDYKANNFDNAVNKDKEYYNYYMYLSNHTKTNYSSINIDSYIRNNLNYSGDVYGTTALAGRSRLYGMGTFFYNAQERGGANAVLALSLSRNETGNGTSNLAINKNNGFGLNAVDSSPGQSANWYATFSSSVLGFASKWITYGYGHPRDWRYYGPQFGDKGIGMNVKYASDTYWSEKMAEKYFALDSAYGLQDYDFYQLGVVTAPVNAMSDATTSSKFLYTYPEKEDAVVIIGEKEGQEINGDTTWYQIVSDLNIDSNFNEITSGNYNWEGYAYIPAAFVKKINTAKDGYKKPIDVFEYQDKNYTYDLMIKDTILSPKIGLSIKETSYYFDSTLTQVRNQKLLKDKYVIIYSVAYDEDNNEVSYLVTSDYMHNEKHWVPADTVKEVAGEYGKVYVDVPDQNAYTWINYNTVESSSTYIGGLFKYAIVPIVGREEDTTGRLWYKIPYNLSGTDQSYGYTLASDLYVSIEVHKTTVANRPPVINANDVVIIQGQKFKEKENVTATDEEDGNLTELVQVVENNVNIDVPGPYKVKYQVTDSAKETTIKEITVTVLENKKPVITAEDFEILEYREYDEKPNVTAEDEEDKDLTNKVVVSNNTVIIDQPGEYAITYQVTDSYNQTVEKTVKVTVIDDENPVINASDIEITQKENYNYKKNVTATDKEDGNLTEKITIINNTVDDTTIGEYEITYQVKDNYNQVTEKTIKVNVVKNKLPVINAVDKTLYLNQTFNELDGVTATDYEDGTIKNIVVLENTVDTKEVGIYKVIYQVTDSFGNIVEKEIKVEVLEQTLELANGLFNLNYLKTDKGKILIQGFQTIYGIDNNLDININYTLIFLNLETKEEINVSATRITKTEDIPKKVYSPDGKDYTYSWFNAEINIDKLPIGNYKMYILAETDKYYVKSLINNNTYKPQSTKVESTNNTATISNNYDTSTAYIELKVRDEYIAEKDSSYIYNQYTKYTKFEFIDNKLYIRGNSYSYGMDLSNDKEVTRNLILEEKTTFKKYTKSLDSITDGNYKVMLPVDDKLDKTRAWFDKQIDISDIPVGEYVIYITTSSNITDFSEFNEKLGRNLDEVTKIIDGKIYSFSVNFKKGSRIELNVEKEEKN